MRISEALVILSKPSDFSEDGVRQALRVATAVEEGIEVEPQGIVGVVVGALTSEDEIAHGEAWDDVRKRGLGVCAYCDRDWPCRTQRHIDRLLDRLVGSTEVPV